MRLDSDAFDEGMAEGLDPQQLPAHVGDSAVTHVSSPWNHRLCATCGQSFRRGDRVRLGGGGTGEVAHLDPGLDCAGGPVDPRSGDDTGQTGRTADIADFAAGVLAAWPPLNDVPVVRLGTADWQVARLSVHGVRPPRCLYCGHTFRAGEHVVLCPCAPDRPACGSAVHRDPSAGLVCWENWRPEGRLAVCPVKLVAVPE